MKIVLFVISNRFFVLIKERKMFTPFPIATPAGAMVFPMPNSMRPQQVIVVQQPVMQVQHQPFGHVPRPFVQQPVIVVQRPTVQSQQPVIGVVQPPTVMGYKVCQYPMCTNQATPGHPGCCRDHSSSCHFHGHHVSHHTRRFHW